MLRGRRRQPRAGPVQGPVYDVVRRGLDRAGRCAEETPLPDDGSGISWAHGALDGSFLHHARAVVDLERVERLADLVEAAAGQRSEAAVGRLAAELDGEVVLLAGPVADELRRRGAEPASVQRLAVHLARTADRRDVVKLALVLLGATGTQDHELLRILGAHPEFTMYAATAMLAVADDPERELRAMAEKVHGWARLACLEQLARAPGPESRRWLIEQTADEPFLEPEYARLAVRSGGLLETLTGPTVTRHQLSRAGNVVRWLMVGTPAYGLDGCPDGPVLLRAYLELLRTRADTVEDLETAVAVHGFLIDAEDWDQRMGLGWTPELRDEMVTISAGIVQAAVWDDRIGAALLSDDPDEVRGAMLAASSRLRDVFDVVVHDIRRAPYDGAWRLAWQQVRDRERATQLADLACELLPLAEVASGPGEELGIGDEWLPHLVVEWCLEHLLPWEGIGGDLVVTGLCSPVPRQRFAALDVLAAWQRRSWPGSAPALLGLLAVRDPVEEVRDQAAELLDRRR